jgi:hypothetical protein
MSKRSPSSHFLFAAAVSLSALVFTTAAAQAEEKPAAPAAAAAPAEAASSTAAAPTPPAPKWYEELTVNALVEAGFGYGLNNPASGKNSLRVFDVPSNSFSVGTALVVLQKGVSNAGDVGFRVDADFGGLIPSLSAGNGEVSPTNFGLRQGFVSWIAPVGSGLRFDLGKFVTLAGYEYIDTFDNINDNASRSILFGYAIPFTHTGLQMSYVLSTSTKVSLMVVNGWDQLTAKSDGKGILAQVALTPSESLSAYINGYIGQEAAAAGAGGNFVTRILGDLSITYKVNPTLTIGVNGDIGMDKGASLVKAGDDATWYGAAGYVRYDHASGAGVALRGEVFKDGGGTRIGVGTSGGAQTVEEITVTPFIKLGGHLTLRGEVRVDIADTSVFVKRDGSFTSSQPTLSLGGVYVY